MSKTRSYGKPRPVFRYLNGKRYVWNPQKRAFVRFIRCGRKVAPLVFNDSLNRAKDFRHDEYDDIKTTRNGLNEDIFDAQTVLMNIKDPPVLKTQGIYAMTSRRKATKYLKITFGIDAKSAFKELQFDVVVAICQEITNAKNLFGVCGAINKIDCLKKEKNKTKEYDEIAARYTIKEGALYFRKDYDIYGYFDRMKRFYQTGHSSTRDWRHTIRHEIGHAIVALFEKNHSFRYDLKKEKLEKLLQFLRSRYNKREYLSRYGSTSVNEMLAECIAQAMNGTASNFAKEVLATLFGKK